MKTNVFFKAGFSGTICQDSGACLNNGCLNGATCVVNPASATGYDCTCASGYTGSLCNTGSQK